MELMIDLHRHNPRQGPGSDADTLRALNMIALPKKPLEIIDIGCGSGSQTLCLAKNTRAHITAVDLFPEFLEELKERSDQAGLADNISVSRQSMDKLDFRKDSIDLIWSEGAIYNMGFENGIKEWRNFLKPGGYLAVSEVTWTNNHRPAEIEAFWHSEYPEIDTASAKIKILEQYGYTLSGYFIIPPGSWLSNYYQPLEEGFASFLQRHNYSATAKRLVQEHRDEIALYQKFKEYYSYGFYIARKDEAF